MPSCFGSYDAPVICSSFSVESAVRHTQKVKNYLPYMTVQRVYFEAVQSLIHHGFRRFMLLTSHAGNRNVSRYLVDRINQETPGIAVELNECCSTIYPAVEAVEGEAV